jgi:hypothetical protein
LSRSDAAALGALQARDCRIDHILDDEAQDASPDQVVESCASSRPPIFQSAPTAAGGERTIFAVGRRQAVDLRASRVAAPRK